MPTPTTPNPPVAAVDTPVDLPPPPSPQLDPQQPKNSGLRAYFASSALNGILASGREKDLKNPLATSRLAWKFADAMIQTQNATDQL